MRVAIALAALLAGACGDDTPGNDSGGGTGTLHVRARVSFEDNNSAELSARVERAGADVLDAVVAFDGDFGEVALVHQGGGQYATAQAGWSRWYRLSVHAGEDWLDGTVEAPGAAEIVEPSPTVAFDPHLAPTVHVEWNGGIAQQVRVKTKDFDWEGADSGWIDIPAASFVETSQEIEVRRSNSVPLAGGAASGGEISQLSASHTTTTTVIVLNPF